MIRLAAVGPADTVFDLGSGDGRLVIAAASECGARGIGVDIALRRVLQSRIKALFAGVSRRVRFVHGDAYGVDLSAATVIFLYLLPSSTQRMAVHLLRHVKPGTRIVSHTFAVDFMPATAVDAFVDSEGMARVVHLWVVDRPSLR
jgi:SAM-dependent methyltransferase